jgi:hypothetical protein
MTQVADFHNFWFDAKVFVDYIHRDVTKRLAIRIVYVIEPRLGFVTLCLTSTAKLFVIAVNFEVMPTLTDDLDSSFV